MTPKSSIIFHFTIKKFDDNLYKVSYFPSRLKKKSRERVSYKPNGRFDESLSRSRSKIFEYAYCNDFDYFVTLTLDPFKRDTKDLKSYISALSRFVRYCRSEYGLDLQYLLIPEKHKSGSWHFHGLIKGLTRDHLVLNNHGYLDWPAYKNRFGYISLSSVKSKERVSKYITKYLTKSFSCTDFAKGEKLYYCSRGLKVSDKIYDCLVQDCNLISQDFQSERLDFVNDYVKFKYIDKDEFNIKYRHLIVNYDDIIEEIEEKEPEASRGEMEQQKAHKIKRNSMAHQTSLLLDLSS
ncbi:MAG: rolling circle replication-associated protein [Candidatus Nanosyncoccaceae bacterium]|jgi:hypothetical protein